MYFVSVLYDVRFNLWIAERIKVFFKGNSDAYKEYIISGLQSDREEFIKLSLKNNERHVKFES